MVTVRTLVAMPELRMTTRVGSGSLDPLLDRTVTRVYGTELPDPSRYLSGGEFVVTGLLWWREAGDAEAFVGALAGAGAAALAASAADLAGQLPEDLVRACVRHRIPLVEASPELSFAVVTERIVLALAADRGTSFLGTHRRLLSAVASGEGGIDALLRTGGDELGAPCMVRTATGRVVAGDPLAIAGTELTQNQRLAVTIPRRSTRALLPWYLVVGAHENELTPDQRAVADDIAGLIGLERTRAVRARRTRDEPARPLLRSLAAGTATPGELATELAAAGVNGTGQLRVLIAATHRHTAETSWPDDEAGGFETLLLDEILAELAVTGPVCAVDTTDGGTSADRDASRTEGTADGQHRSAYALVETRGPWPEHAVTLARGVLDVATKPRGASTVVAISGATPATGLRGAAEEARHALRLGRRRLAATAGSPFGKARTARGEVVAGDEIAVRHLLLAGAPDELRHALRERLLGAVEAYDTEHGGDLLLTLRTFLECSASWRATAQRLHVHVNTLRYRMGRVEQLLGTDLSDFGNRVDLYLALEVDRG